MGGGGARAAGRPAGRRGQGGEAAAGASTQHALRAARGRAPGPVDLAVVVDLLDDAHLAVRAGESAHLLPLLVVLPHVQLRVLQRQLHLGQHQVVLLVLAGVGAQDELLLGVALVLHDLLVLGVGAGAGGGRAAGRARGRAPGRGRGRAACSSCRAGGAGCLGCLGCLLVEAALAGAGR